ncbi:MAG: aspartyl protease family protein [Sphingomicrobium sp.]
MRALSFLPVILAGFGASPALAQNLPQSMMNVLDTVRQREQVDSTTQADDVKIRRDGTDRMTVPVTVGGNGPFRFLVDTGADRTAISSAVAAQLGLDTSVQASLHSVTGISTVQTATVKDLRLSQQDLKIVDAPVLEAANMGADGILGTDSLRSQRVVFDFQKNMMTIVPAEQQVPKEDGSIVVTGKLRNGRLIVTNAVADGNTITVILDTGSEVSIGNEALRRRLGNAGLLKSTGAVGLESVTGEILQGEYTFVKRLEVGEVNLANLAVVFADAHTFGKLGLDNRPALLLGMNALRAFKKVSIDFANKKLRVILPETGSLPQVQLAAR